MPPTEVGGSFKSSLQRNGARLASSNTTHGSGWIVQVQPTKEWGSTCFFEYHPRQWVDRSSPAYKGMGLDLLLRIPPTAVGGSFKSSLQRNGARLASSNTTHGSGWMVQVKPTKEWGSTCFFEYHPRQWVDGSSQ